MRTRSDGETWIEVKPDEVVVKLNTWRPCEGLDKIDSDQSSSDIRWYETESSITHKRIVCPLDIEISSNDWVRRVPLESKLEPAFLTPISVEYEDVLAVDCTRVHDASGRPGQGRLAEV